MSSFLQTPEFYDQKLLEAKQLVGKHILVCVTFPNGVVLGKTFNNRSHRNAQWVFLVGSGSIILGGIGDFRDFGNIRSAVSSVENFIEESVGLNELTAAGLSKFVSSHYGGYLEEPQVLAVETVIADCAANELYAILISSRIRRFSDFVVLGADEYSKPFEEADLTEEEMAAVVAGTLRSAQEMPQSLQEKIKKRALESRLVRKPAIEFLKQAVAALPYEVRTAESAESLVQNTLFMFDPPSESNKFELMVFRRDTGDNAVLVSKLFERVHEQLAEEEDDDQRSSDSESDTEEEEQKE